MNKFNPYREFALDFKFMQHVERLDKKQRAKQSRKTQSPASRIKQHGA